MIYHDIRCKATIATVPLMLHSCYNVLKVLYANLGCRAQMQAFDKGRQIVLSHFHDTRVKAVMSRCGA